MIYALDPGPVESALVAWDGQRILFATKAENDFFFKINPFHCETDSKPWPHGKLIIEQVASYGMAVGAEVFETVFFSGRIAQAWPWGFDRMPRMDVKLHLCHNSRARDKNIRQALVDRFGPPGTKKAPNLIHNGFKISNDIWQAWALAVTWVDTHGGDAT